MEWKKIKKILICMVVVLLVSIIFSNVYADINEQYYKDNLGAFKVADTTDALDKKSGSSILLDALGNLVYVLASFGEWLLGIIFQAATAGAPEQNNIFPWADAIVFNAIPFLDVNFLNPYSGGGTVVGLIETVIKSVYGTVFGLAISFFSIAVLVMGIKLAISTIASEKAKYKQALMDWFVGLLLLFTIHFFISFVFYLNEQLVNKASEIASDSINNSEAKQLIKSLNENHDADIAVENFIDAMGTLKITDVLTLGLNRLGDGIDGSVLPSLDTAKQLLRDNPEITVSLLQNEAYRYWRFGDRNAWYALDASSSDKFWTWSRGDQDLIRVVGENVEDIINGGADLQQYKDKYDELKAKSTKTDKEEHQMEFCKTVVDTHAIHIKKEGVSSGKSLIANLAQYFKATAWSMGENSWKSDKIVIQNAIMYAILVVQSFIFLIAYVKRLFYVVILAMMAPLVVVYDFFNKSMS